MSNNNKVSLALIGLILIVALTACESSNSNNNEIKQDDTRTDRDSIYKMINEN